MLKFLIYHVLRIVNFFSSISFKSNSQLKRIESLAFSGSSLQSIEIPEDVEIFGSSCFQSCKSLSSISFKSNSRLKRIESGTFADSSLQSIEIPENVEIIGPSCFQSCESLSSISFESNPRLKRIESFAFSSASLQSIEIPRNVQFIDGSAFSSTKLKSISITPGHERFVMNCDFLIDHISHRLIRNFSSSSHFEICEDIEILGSSCFENCDSLSSISFPSNSRLKRIETRAFGDRSFSFVVPSTILFIAYDAVECPFQIELSDHDSCPEFGQWQQLLSFGVVVDFRRHCRACSNLPSLSHYQFDLSGFNQGPLIKENGCVSTQIYHRHDDDVFIVIKSFLVPVSVERCLIEREIENLIHLRHPCIAAPIGFIHSVPHGELKIVRLYSSGGSLSEIVSVSPEWWTPTAKAKAVAGIVLGLQCGHSLGLLHGHLTANNIFFNEEGVVQIADFCMNRLGERDWSDCDNVNAGCFFREDWTTKAGICAFAEILSQIVIGASDGESNLSVPKFVSEMIDQGRSAESKTGESFGAIFKSEDYGWC
jgi:hypothetical protein